MQLRETRVGLVEHDKAFMFSKGIWAPMLREIFVEDKEGQYVLCEELNTGEKVCFKHVETVMEGLPVVLIDVWEMGKLVMFEGRLREIYSKVEDGTILMKDLIRNKLHRLPVQTIVLV